MASAVDWLVGNALPLPMFGNASALPMPGLGGADQALPLGGRLGGDTGALPLGNVGRYDVGALPVTFNTVAGLKKQREDWANNAEKRATGRQAQAVGQATTAAGRVPGSVPEAYRGIVAEAAQKYGVDPALIGAMMAQESGGNPNAVSSAGAQGLMQVIPSTGAMYGVSDPAALRDPATSIDVGVHYFADLLKQYGGNVENALAAYNGGPRGVTAPVAETRQYVPAVMARYRASQAAVAAAPAIAANPAGSVFPVVGYRGPIGPHWGGVLGGMDIMAAEGTPVVAMRGGTVTNTGYSPTAGGNWAEIRGDDGNLYYYAHMQGPAQVSPGVNVPAGTPLGFVGRTGNARNTPPHLHLGIGPNIETGVGPSGGTGGSFNAVALLQAAYDAALAAAGAP